MIPNLRLAWAALALSLSLLAVLEAPTYAFWMAALVVTEWGHWLAWLCLLPLLPGWRGEPLGWAAAAAGTAGFLLMLSPAARAWAAARSLEPGLAGAFGGGPEPGRAPLSFVALYRGTGKAEVRASRAEFSAPGGGRMAMDVYYPEPEGRLRPMLLAVHGGSWRSGERSEFADFHRALAGRGCVVASTDYRLAPASVFPAQVDDVRAALLELKRRAAEFGGDPGKLFLVGRSAGGQIALSAAYGPGAPALRGVAAFYAPNDMVFAYNNPSPPRIMDSRGVLEAYMGGPPERTPGLYERASPLGQVGPATPATLLVHGGRDELVRRLHSERLEARLAAAGRPVYYLRLPWATHACDYNLSGPAGQLSFYALERFIGALSR